MHRFNLTLGTGKKSIFFKKKAETAISNIPKLFTVRCGLHKDEARLQFVSRNIGDLMLQATNRDMLPGYLGELPGRGHKIPMLPH
jgi:hypothetical protein